MVIELLPKYKQNLRIIDNVEVWSYDSHVATIVGATLIQHLWDRSLGVKTTQKHINYVADQLDLDVVKQWKGVDV